MLIIVASWTLVR
uniref:Uncharacterized protein n=1 Tax=Anguilla anguilla TaxID=7936 RepID=A0A0E9RXQ7_ANGAN